VEDVLGWISLLMAAAVAIFVVWQIRAGKHPILSARNFFLVGFIVYQLTSATISFFSRVYWEVTLTDPVSTGMLYLVWCAAFLIVMLVTYETKWFTMGIPRRLAPSDPSPAPLTMMSLAVGFLVVGYAMRFGFQFVPVLGILGTMTGVTLAIAAAGMACWVWSRQIFNPARASFALVIVGLAMSLTIFRSFGRRDMVSAAIVCLWAVYHGHFKKQNLTRMFLPVSGVALAGLLLISARTSVRNEDSKTGGIVSQITAMANADFKAGLLDVFAGQGTAPISMWLMESRPDSYEYDTLHSLKYVVLNIIPREYWPQKPESLGLTMVREADITRKGVGFTVGPGLMGHIANDNPYLALVLYAVLFGAFLRIMDEMVLLAPDNPFVVIPVGVALGEIVAIPRGEAGLFVFRTILAVVAAYIGMRVVAKILVSLGMRYNVSLTDGDAASTPAGPYADGHSWEADAGLAYPSESASEQHMPNTTSEGDGRAGPPAASQETDLSYGPNTGSGQSPSQVPWGLQGS